MGIPEQIKELEEEIEKTPYNKATQKHIGMLKAKLARLREGALSSGGGGAGFSFSVKKTGDATALMVGLPSAGKSTLINAITNAQSKTAAYEFTTLDVIPGILEHNGARIQVLDLPGIIEGASVGKGHGKKILSAVRNADLILAIIDGSRDIAWQLNLINTELYSAGFRLNKRRPDVRIVKKTTGGVNITSGRLTHLDKQSIEAILKEFKIVSADVLIRDDITADDLVDCMVPSRVYVPLLVIINKADIMKDAKKVPKDAVLISAKKKANMDALAQAIWNKLSLSRIYLKRVGKEPDMKEPLIMKKGCRVIDVCTKIHREFAKNFRYARIWGPSARFAGQRVGMELVLKDGDIVEFHTN